MTITELEQYFDTADLPTTPVQTNKYSTINDTRFFVAAQMAYIKREPETYKKTSAYLRLIAFKEWLESEYRPAVGQTES